jgi:hypothetical protein
MNIVAKIFDKKIEVECRNKPVTFGSEGPKIGKIIDSKIENDSLIVTIKINKKWNKKISDLFKSRVHANYEIKNKENKIILEAIKLKPSKIKRR